LGNYSILFIDKQEVDRFKYDIPFIALIPFKPEDYNRGIFKTTVKKANERYISYGITLEKLEKKIAELINTDPEILKKFRETGEDELAVKTNDEDSLDVAFEIFGDDEPELYGLYLILQELSVSNDNDVVEFDIKDMEYFIPEFYSKKNISKLFDDAKKEYNKSLMKINVLEDFKEHDFFICHDSRDKKSFVAPLATALKKKEINPWYDKFVLKAGDSLIGRIDEGLKSSKFGIVVLSKNFIFNTKWPKDEFISLRTKELHSGKKLIIPIWRKDITKSDVIKYNLELADRFALQEKNGIKSIVRDLEVKLKS